jgi:hypothetical protein
MLQYNDLKINFTYNYNLFTENIRSDSPKCVPRNRRNVINLSVYFILLMPYFNFRTIQIRPEYFIINLMNLCPSDLVLTYLPTELSPS